MQLCRCFCMFVLEGIALPGKLCQMLRVYNIPVVFGVCLSLKKHYQMQILVCYGQYRSWEVLFDLATCH